MLRYITLLLCLSVFIANCKKSKKEEPPPPQVRKEAGPVPIEKDKGFGPVKSITLGAIDPALAKKGKEIFDLKCIACHKMEQRFVGPPLGNTANERTPEWIMNMILNPVKMVDNNPNARKLLAKFMVKMANQNVKREEARAILEYLRVEAKKPKGQKKTEEKTKPTTLIVPSKTGSTTKPTERRE